MPEAIHIGAKMLCKMLDRQNNPTGAYALVEVTHISRHWKTNVPESVRIKSVEKGRKVRFIWVQAEMLSPIEPTVAA